jgi:regulator of protease activity HflC (stomatin/prohibitin superfamily)
MKWLNENWLKIFMLILLVFGYSLASNQYFLQRQKADTSVALENFQENKTPERNISNLESGGYIFGWMVVGLISFLTLKGSIKLSNSTKVAGIVLLALSTTGCGLIKPFKPVKLEAIESHEVAFLIPYLQDGTTQESSKNEEFYKQRLVFAQQVQIPQQWVQQGYEFIGYNGQWRDAAVLIKVDTQPVTREWTADPNSGTSDRNEAIWVMTSDQVEFSTGWNVTARIKDRDDSVKFLSNYPNGSLQKVLDQEVHAKLQTTFALAVTDLPMDTLRKAATPVIEKTSKEVIDFFEKRGVTITNLGITGGFVYKDKTIMDTLVKVFNAEQDKNIAAAATAAQEEKNKKILLEASGKADALLKEKKAEADGIKAIAEAKFYELEKAKQNLQDYVSLKNLELTKELINKWDGNFPEYYMGSGGDHPNTLLQLPAFGTQKKE